MGRILAAVCLTLGLCAGQARAAVELLPGSSPQRAEQGRDFAPIRVRVTDASGAPVAGTRVSLHIPYGAPLFPSGLGDCLPDLGLNCAATTDAGGVAQFPPLYGNVVGEYSFSIGGVPVTLTVEPFRDPPTLVAVSAVSQSVVTGATFPPFVVRALDARGRPIAGVEVTFVQNQGAAAIFAGSYRYASVSVLTDSGGNATAPPVVAGAGLGAGVMRASLVVPGTTTESGRASTTPSPMHRAPRPSRCRTCGGRGSRRRVGV